MPQGIYLEAFLVHFHYMKSRHKEAFNILKRATSLSHALRGVGLYVRITPNALWHILTFILLIVLGFYFTITKIEWLLLVISNGLVLSAEAFNSAIEIDMDLTHPEEHHMVRDTKDMAAGAVLITGVVSWVAALIIFVPYI